jgi:hypothetical protein
MLTTSAIVRHVAMRFPPLAISGFHDRVPTRLGTVELDLPDRVNRKPGGPRLWHWLTKGVVHYEAMYVTKCARRPDTPPQREGDGDVIGSLPSCSYPCFRVVAVAVGRSGQAN